MSVESGEKGGERLAGRRFGDVILKPSPIEGLGMFAARPFRAGERILHRRFVRDVTPETPLRPELGEYERHCDWLAAGRVVLLGLPDRHFNHRCDPNAYVREIDGAYYIYARRDIAEGEEITNDYCMGSVGDDWWDCNCGAPSCRGRIRGDYFSLPLEKQIEYLPLLMDWFVEEHRERIAALRTIADARGASPKRGRLPDADDIRQKVIDRPIDLTEETARKLIDRLDRTGALRPVHHIRSNQVVSAVLGTIGIALFIVGVERAAEDIPVVSNPYGSIAIGVVLLVATGALLARLRTH